MRENGCYDCKYFFMYDDDDGRVDELCELEVVGCWEEYEVYKRGCDKWEER
jgi:hypothetical protein